MKKVTTGRVLRKLNESRCGIVPQNDGQTKFVYDDRNRRMPLVRFISVKKNVFIQVNQISFALLIARSDKRVTVSDV